MDKFRKLICYIFGHKSICLFRFHWGHDNGPGYYGQGSESTSWVCQRCGFQHSEQWDT